MCAFILSNGECVCECWRTLRPTLSSFSCGLRDRWRLQAAVVLFPATSSPAIASVDPLSLYLSLAPLWTIPAALLSFLPAIHRSHLFSLRPLLLTEPLSLSLSLYPQNQDHCLASEPCHQGWPPECSHSGSCIKPVKHSTKASFLSQVFPVTVPVFRGAPTSLPIACSLRTELTSSLADLVWRAYHFPVFTHSLSVTFRFRSVSDCQSRWFLPLDLFNSRRRPPSPLVKASEPCRAVSVWSLPIHPSRRSPSTSCTYLGKDAVLWPSCAPNS